MRLSGFEDRSVYNVFVRIEQIFYTNVLVGNFGANILVVSFGGKCFGGKCLMGSIGNVLRVVRFSFFLNFFTPI